MTDLILIANHHTKKSARGGLILLVRWGLDGMNYPAEVWYEDAAVLLTMWSNSILRLARGETKETLHFMEGDYALELDREATTIKAYAQHSEWSATIELVELAVKISDAGARVLSEMKVRKIRGPIRNELQFIHRMLANWIAARSG